MIPYITLALPLFHIWGEMGYDEGTGKFKTPGFINSFETPNSPNNPKIWCNTVEEQQQGYNVRRDILIILLINNVNDFILI